MRKVLLALVLLAITATPVLAYAPEGDGSSTERLGPPSGYKGSWYTVKGKAVKQEDLVFEGPASPVVAAANNTPSPTTCVFYSDGNYACFYNAAWNYYMCQANDGSGMVCKYYSSGGIACVWPQEASTK